MPLRWARPCVPWDAVALGQTLHQFETDPTAAQLLEGIRTVGTFRIKHGHGFRQHIARSVVVADDHVDTAFRSIRHLVHGLDPAVERDDQAHTLAGRPIDAQERDAITFGITVGDVEREVAGEALQEGIDQGHGRGAIHIVIAVHHDALVLAQSPFDAFDGHEHVGHQEGVVQLLQRGPEVDRGRCGILQATLHEQCGRHGWASIIHHAAKNRFIGLWPQPPTLRSYCTHGVKVRAGPPPITPSSTARDRSAAPRAPGHPGRVSAGPGPPVAPGPSTYRDPGELTNLRVPRPQPSTFVANSRAFMFTPPPRKHASRRFALSLVATATVSTFIFVACKKEAGPMAPSDPVGMSEQHPHRPRWQYAHCR